jgi:hypothetical protein
LKFRATVIPSGNATGVEIPEDVMQALGPQGRPPVMITIDTHTWRSRVAPMRGMKLVGISAANRAAAGIAEGDIVEVDIRHVTSSEEAKSAQIRRRRIDKLVASLSGAR